jgi:hypothetical protein
LAKKVGEMKLAFLFERDQDFSPNQIAASSIGRAA